MIEAGERINVIPDHAVAKADVRAALPEEFDRVEKDLVRIAANKQIPDTEVTTRLEHGLPPMPPMPPMPHTAASDRLLAMARASMASWAAS